MRWLLLDEVIEIKKSRSVRTRSRVPQAQVSPEILMLEMMAQTGGLLVGAESDFQANLIFAKIESAAFERAEAGEPLVITAASENLRPEGSWVDAQIESRGRRVANARLLLMNAGALIPGASGSVTFHEEFMNHFKVREKIK